VGVGMVVGILGIAKLLGVLLDKYETEGLFLFVGLILGTLPGLLKEARQKGVGKGSWIAMFGMMALMLAWMIPMTMGGQAAIVPNFFWWCVCGVLWGMGIIIPGMSPSNIFLFLGLAEPMYAAIGRLDMSVIIPMGVFLVLGIVALSKSINFCLNKHYSVFMHAIVGVVLASTVIIIPPVKMALDPSYTFAMGAGNWVVISHGNGIVTKYMHSSATFVSPGDQVTRGQNIGLVGNTGNSFGAHLHFQVEVDGVAVNPLNYI